MGQNSTGRQHDSGLIRSTADSVVTMKPVLSLALQACPSPIGEPVNPATTEGFGYLVTSIAAPAASSWSDYRVGFAPTGKRRILTTHTHCGHAAPHRINHVAS
jgi:hypothetical protein